MTEEYKFFDSTSDDIREYSAGDFANYWGSIYTSGLLFEQNTLALQVTANGSLTTKVGSGKALIKGHAYENTESLIMVHNPSSSGRIDRVVLRMDLGFNQRYIRLFVKEGTASAPPSLTRTEQIYELSLAQVKVRAGASSITASDITDERLNEEVCGPVVALVAAMAFSYPSDVPSDITYIKDKMAEFDVLKGLIEDVKLTINNNSIFSKTHYSKDFGTGVSQPLLDVTGKGVLEGINLYPSNPNSGASVTITIDDSASIGLSTPTSEDVYFGLNITFKHSLKADTNGGTGTALYAI